MTYFRPNHRKVLRLIKEISEEVGYTDSVVLCSSLPQKWRLEGCGTGNIKNCLIQLNRRGFILPYSKTPDYTGAMVSEENQSFYITEKGERQLKSWLIRYWQPTTALLVSIATIVIAIYTVFSYYQNN